MLSFCVKSLCPTYRVNANGGPGVCVNVKNTNSMNEADYLKQQIASLQRRLAEIERPQRDYELRQQKEKRYDFTIEFDGGTTCNNPAQGFGEGYGSWQVNQEPICRVKFGYGHSCNSAEVRTLVDALRALSLTLDDPKSKTVFVRGDSKIALKWVTSKQHPTRKSTEKFQEAIYLLRVEVAKFKSVKTEWRGREHSVRIFGH